jgi:YfiH family protein
VTFRAAGEHLAIDLPGATALFTTRRGGVSEGPYASLNVGLLTDDDPERVAANRERVRAQAGADHLAQGRQVHGTRVSVDDGTGEEADGQVTTLGGVAAIVLVADCLPVALAGPDAAGVVHAGWRGLANGVLEAGVAAIGRGPVTAAIGPGIGPCCYEVGEEVAAPFRRAFGLGLVRDGKLDLWSAAERALRAAGCTRVDRVDLCTACSPERFFSHRRDAGITGRQGVIGIIG